MDVVGPVWWGWGGQSCSAAEFLDIRVWGENWWKELAVKSGGFLPSHTVFNPSLAILCCFLIMHSRFVRPSFSILRLFCFPVPLPSPRYHPTFRFSTRSCFTDVLGFASVTNQVGKHG